MSVTYVEEQWLAGRPDSLMGDIEIYSPSENAFALATVHNGGNERATKAKADLIVAAPKLLAALKSIRDARDHYAKHGVYPQYVGDRCFDDWAADLADAAIANAEGKSST